MAITQCRECGKDTSTEARTCPNCGAPRPAQKNWKGTGIDWKWGPLFYGYPFVHVAFGRDKNNRLRVAKGVVAVGQFAIGVITFAQFGIGIIFGFGQFIFGLTAVAQFAGGLLFGLGQFASGYVAIGQLVVAWFGLCQVGIAKHIWMPRHQDLEALQFFQPILEKVKILLRIKQ